MEDSEYELQYEIHEEIMNGTLLRWSSESWSTFNLEQRSRFSETALWGTVRRLSERLR